jgi:hypothetical protein
VTTGVWLLLAGYLGFILVAAANISSAFDRPWFTRPTIAMVVVMAHAAGVFLVTTREPGRWRRHGWRRIPWGRPPAWTLRLCSLAPVIAVPLQWYFVLRTSTLPDAPLLLTTLHIAPMLCPALTMIWLSQFAVRVGWPGVAMRAAIAGSGFTGAIAMTGIAQVASSGEIAFVILFAGLAVGAIFYFWIVWNLIAISQTLRGALDDARMAWRNADASRSEG